MQKPAFIYFTVSILRAQNGIFNCTDLPVLRSSVKKKKTTTIGLLKTFFKNNIIQLIALFILALQAEIHSLKTDKKKDIHKIYYY